MKTKKEIMSLVSTLTIQQKKQGYSRILEDFLIRLRYGEYFTEEETRLLAHIIHNLPHFLGKDLADFNDEWFWDYVLKHNQFASMIIEWFWIGVHFEKIMDDFYKETQEKLADKKAE
jgi:hypothetical protein